jgi:DNA-binding NarL/FixJ family response regulator
MLVDLIDSTPEYRCVCACATSKEALSEVPKRRPDVVLMDIHLPDESGIACTAQLTGLMPDLPVIMVTVYKDMNLIFEALKAGACGYILKRFRPQEILGAIAEVRAGGAPMTREIASLVVRSFRAPAAAPGANLAAREAEVLTLPADGSPPAAAPGTDLTAREAEILTLLADGLSNKEIAQKTDIKVGTVRTHVEHIYRKLHVRGRTAASAIYFRARQGEAPAPHP